MSHRLSRLFNPASIAVVGASARPGRPGCNVIRNLHDIGFSGPVYPVTPRYESIEGHACVDEITNLDTSVDLAIVAGASARMESSLEKVIESGASAALCFANAFLPEDRNPALLERIRDMAHEADLVLLGPNTIGYVNYTAKVNGTWMGSHHYTPGPIAAVIQSGSTYSYAGNLDPRLRFSFLVQPGQEALITVGECMDYALEVPGTRALALYLETVRNPDSFISALEKAREKDIPVIALHIGRSQPGARFVETHAGRLAGSTAALEAVFRRYGVLAVKSMDEWWATTLLLSHERRPGPGGIGAITDSGGQRAHLTDIASDVGVRWASVGETTTRRLRERLDPSLLPVNPVDAWAGGPDWQTVFSDCFEAVMKDEDTAIGVVFTEFGSSDKDPLPAGLAAMAGEVATHTEKPVVAASFSNRQFYSRVILELNDAGIPMLDSGEQALRAIKHAFDYRDAGNRVVTPSRAPSAEPELVERWRARLLSPAVLSEIESLALLEDFGVPVIESRMACTESDALGAARAIGFPVALKTADPSLTHKSDHGGVCLDLRDESSLADAYRDLATRLGPAVTVASMAPAGVEMGLGVISDPLFGPLLMIGAGGVYVELAKDIRFVMPPVTTEDIEPLLSPLTISKLLAGYRGKPPADINSLGKTVIKLSGLALVLSDVIEGIDINPVIVSPLGCVAVDALIKTKPGGAQQP